MSTEHQQGLRALFQKVVRVEIKVRIETVGRGTVQFLMLIVLLAKGGKPHVTQKEITKRTSRLGIKSCYYLCYMAGLLHRD